MRKWIAACAALAGAAATAAWAEPPHAADTPLLTAADGTSWYLEPSSVMPLALGQPGVYQFWISGDSPPSRTAVRQWKVRIYLYCPAKWYIPSLVAGVDGTGTTVSKTTKGWAAPNWISAKTSEVVMKAATFVCPS